MFTVVCTDVVVVVGCVCAVCDAIVWYHCWLYCHCVCADVGVLVVGYIVTVVIMHVGVVCVDCVDGVTILGGDVADVTVDVVGVLGGVGVVVVIVGIIVVYYGVAV